MTLHDLGELVVRLAAIGLAAGAATGIVKFGLRALLVWRGRFPKEGTPARDTWRDGIRTLAVVVGALFGCLDVWPLWDRWQFAFGPLLGLVAGMSAPALYDAWFGLWRGAPDTLLDTFRARFGGGRAGRRRGRRARRQPNPVNTRPDGLQRVGDDDAPPRDH